MSNETLNTNVALYAKTMVHYLIHEYVFLTDAKLLPLQLRTSYYPVQFRWCLLTCDEMLCFSFWIRSSLRLPKVPATLEILRSITLSSGHLHVRSKMQKSIQILASIHNKMYFYVEIDLHEIVAHRISQSQFTSYIVNQRCTCIFYIVLKVRKAFRGHKPSDSCIIIIIKVNLRLEALYFYMVCFF